jgi:isoquinoline 1-oxidoreductase subunit beta
MNKIDRREFIKLSVTGSTVFALGINLTNINPAWSNSSENETFAPNIWLEINSQNICTVTITETELGQGIYTSLAALVADELDFDISQVNIKRASSSDIYGSQTTGGSSGIRSNWLKFRKAGAIARKLFIEAAAKKWSISAEQCYTKSSSVYANNKDLSLTYASLITQANQLNIPDQISLKSPQQFNIIGKHTPRIDSPEKVTGEAVFGIDVQLPDMLIATTIHPPVFGAKVGNINNENTKNITGLIKIITIDNAVAVIAKDYWSANKAAQALSIEWINDNQTIDDNSIKKTLSQSIKNQGVIAKNKGDIHSAYNGSTLTAEYSAPFQAHATMEPMNCTVHMHDGMCEIWAPTQSPTEAKATAKKYYYTLAHRVLKKARSFLSSNNEDDILVHTTYAGGGFGRRLKQDFVAEAVQIATHFDQPVKLIWSREEDTQHDHYRPAAFCKFEAKLNKSGYPVSFIHKIASPSLAESLWPGYIDEKNGLDKIAIKGASQLAYEIENHQLTYEHSQFSIPLGFWRSVGSSINAYHIESFIDELANKANIDSYQYRSKMLRSNPRLLKTLSTVAKLSNWKQDPDAYYGIACHSSYGSHVSHVAKIIKRDNKLTLEHVYCVIDCGLFVNPDIVKAQLEGSVIFGLSSLFSEINIKEGRVQQSNFHDFPISRFNQTPKISCDIIQSPEEPGGVGEPGVPTVVPAILNALFAATGERIRHLPLNSSTFVN